MAKEEHHDKCPSMVALLADRVEGRDYVIVCRSGGSGVAVLAPHGGAIEPTTSTIACAVAGAEHGIFCFEGRLKHKNFEELHVSSAQYDEPRCLALVAASQFAVAIHGLKYGDSVDVGGLNEALQENLVRQLEAADFRARVDRYSDHSGRDRANICNRGARGGAQLEIPKSIRDDLCVHPERLTDFATAVRAAIDVERGRLA